MSATRVTILGMGTIQNCTASAYSCDMAQNDTGIFADVIPPNHLNSIRFGTVHAILMRKAGSSKESLYIFLQMELIGKGGPVDDEFELDVRLVHVKVTGRAITSLSVDVERGVLSPVDVSDARSQQAEVDAHLRHLERSRRMTPRFDSSDSDLTDLNDEIVEYDDSFL